MNINLKVRLRNKAFWIGLVSAGIIVTQSLGYKVVPEQVNAVANVVLGLGVTLGIIVDTSTPGLKDKTEQE